MLSSVKCLPFLLTLFSIALADNPICPYKEGNFCIDSLWCCPSGSFCIQNKLPSPICAPFLPFSSFELIPKRTLFLNQTYVVCPDSKTVCSNNQVCCPTAAGFACCPFEKGVCCGDGAHCCPEGTTCSIDKKTCFRSLAVEFGTDLRQVLFKNITCQDNSTCKETATCCKMSDGKFGCCPLQNAVCCLDGMHCCPKGSACNEEAHKCQTPTTSVPSKQLEKANARKDLCDDGTICPTNKYCCELASKNGSFGCCSITKPNQECPDETICSGDQTCCLLDTGSWGCCPYENAVCCKDHAHCCPSGFICDIPDGKCIAQVKTMPPKLVLTLNDFAISDNKCNDGTGCPDHSTCCETPGGNYGCCDYENATCCANKKFCCPHGYTCQEDVPDKTICAKKAANSYLEPKIIQHKTLCPDKTSYCEGLQTCCLMSSGRWGCCPYQFASCCQDGLHCCPHNYHCFGATASCIPNESSNSTIAIPWSRKVPGKMPPTSENSICPDKKQECLNDQTCCLMSKGVYGCCPYKNANCCSDRVHCCPTDTRCNNKTKSCDRMQSLESLRRYPIIKAPDSLSIQSSTCPKEVNCPLGATCCRNMTNGFGCCMLPNALDCLDGLHCCPQDTQCDLVRGLCVPLDKHDRPTRYLLIEQTVPSDKVNRSAVHLCPDHQTSCDEDETCCVNSQGHSTCCPLPHAVCCPQSNQCCPLGSSCEDSGCQDLIKDEQSATICPDQKSKCPSNAICCEKPKGGYGCCRKRNGVCCEDGEYCCPQGFRCDPTLKRCFHSINAVDQFWSRVFDAEYDDPEAPTFCPDHRSKCPPHTICCPKPEGGYGCCRKRNGVCCQDGRHCCPEGFKCDSVHRRCTHSSNGLNKFWSHIFESEYELDPREKDDPEAPTFCPDHRSKCPPHTICCPKPEGGYGCCRKRNGVCCQDGRHCCAEGFKCDSVHRRCVHTSMKVTQEIWSHLFQIDEQAHHMHTCPDKKRKCKNGRICCAQLDKSFKCCPKANSTCCANSGFCCPSNTTCSADGKTCLPKEYYSHQPIQLDSGEFLCGNRHRICEKNETCCQNGEESMACCPFKNGVCCANGKHCCPENTKCSEQSSHCLTLKNGKFADLSLLLKEPIPITDKYVLPSKEKDNCKACQLIEGACCAHTCCPHSNGVCCANNTTCCPPGAFCTEMGNCLYQGKDDITFQFRAQNTVYANSVTRRLTVHKDVNLSENSIPVFKNTPSFVDIRLRSKMYRLIKWGHWTICDKKRLCPKDSKCCPDGGCAPKGTNCCLSGHCPFGYNCKNPGLLGYYSQYCVLDAEL